MFEGLQAIRKELKEAKLENPDREEIHDGYQLRFVGKDYAKFITGLPTETVLVPDTEWNNQEQNKNSENIFITGDNLDALKHLENAYSGRIKMIYIDPPYNTGKDDDFTYPDKFEFSDEELREKLGLSENEVSRIRALENKSSHSAWLTFMLPRLAIAKRLLTDDGVIFISIDDNEQANLKLLCDEIFTERNILGCVVRATGTTTGQDANVIGSSLDYLLCYKKSPSFVLEGIELSEDDLNRFKESDEKGQYSFLQLRKTGNADRRKDRPNMYYPVISPEGREVYPIGPTGYESRWRVSKDTYEELLRNGMIIWKENRNGEIQPYVKYYANGRTKQVSNLWYETKENPLWKDIDGNKKGSIELKDTIGEKVFSNPKPLSFIIKMLKIAQTDNSIILDFFAGSATTAHAVMSLNQKDSGNRKYIMVQLYEPTYEIKNGKKIAKNGVKEIAFKAGYESIDEIARDRIKKAAKQLGDTTGFKHYKLAKVKDDIVLGKIDKFNPDKPNLFNDDMLEPFSGKSLGTKLEATGTQTLLTTWLVDDGYTLTTSVNEVKLGNYTAYMPQDSHCLYLIEKGWNGDATKDLLNNIEKNELIVQSIVIYNHSFNFTALTELKNNLQSVSNKDIKLIERF